ncbi:hypothetical protein ACFFRR_005508 [Megaselia abdita]
MDNTLNDSEAGYVGIEYIIKYVSKRTNEMVYECLMCGLILPTQGMQSHVLGYQHRSKYLTKHFPTLSLDIRNYVNDDLPNFTRIMCRIFDDICASIEKHHGRQIPKQFNEDIVERERMKITNDVFSLRHASESNGPMFIELINKMKIDRFIREIQSTSDTFSSKTNSHGKFDSGSKYKRPSFEKEMNRPRYDRFREIDRVNSRSDKRREQDRERSRDRGGSPRDYRHSKDTHRYRERSRSRDRHIRNSKRYGPKNPINLHLYDQQPLSDDAHKKLVEEFLQQTIDKSTPTKSIEDECKKKKCVQGDDIRSKLDRNRKAESPHRPDDIWQIYRKMFDQAVISINEEYKRYRNDPESHPEYNSEWKSFWCKRKEELAKEGIDYKNHDFQVEWINFFKNRVEGLFEEDVEKIKINVRKQLDLPIDNQMVLASKYMLKEPVEEHVNCLSVLRILTALENDLGSLGPKAVELMTKALTLEKISAGGSDKLLNDENCTFFETVNEKLKGLVLVLGLEGSKLKTVTSVIANITTLITTRNSSNGNYSGQGVQNQSEIDFKRLSLGLAAKGKNVDSEKIKEIISLYNLLSNNKKAKEDSMEKNKSLSATLVDFLSNGVPKNTELFNTSTRQDTLQQVSSTSEISLAEVSENSLDIHSAESDFNKL